MTGLDGDARSVLENSVDMILKNPKEFEIMYSNALREQGIEPNLETLLSHITGVLFGIVSGVCVFKHKRSLYPEEVNELITLLKRRAFEIRQAFISTRIEQ